MSNMQTFVCSHSKYKQDNSGDLKGVRLYDHITNGLKNLDFRYSVHLYINLVITANRYIYGVVIDF